MAKLNTEQLFGENKLSREEKIKMFEDLLTSTKRIGVDKIIDFCRRTDFYTAPASTKYHSNYEGGLLDHCLMVYSVACGIAEKMIEIDPTMSEQLNDNSLIISCLLHDICKTCMYVPAKKWKKDEYDQWIQYDGYDIQDTFPIGHGEKSVIMLQNLGLDVDVCEMLAIRYHMGYFGESNKEFVAQQQNAIDICKLVLVVQMADHSASMMFEKTL